MGAHASSGSVKTSPGLLLRAIAAGCTRRAAETRLALAGPALTLQRAKAPRLAGTPRDFRPLPPQAGGDALAGRLTLAGSTLDLGPDGDPWNRASPSRRFAVELHRFAFLPALTAAGEPGARTGRKLVLDWRRAFGRRGGFGWGEEVLERRVYNLACAVRRLASGASEIETAELTGSLLQQAARLAALPAGPVRAAERWAAVAVASGALDGPAAERLLATALGRLVRALGETVLADGGHRTRSPEAGLELLFDLLTLDDLLLQRGREAPPAVVSSVDRLGAALRVLAPPDGRLCAFHGGEAVDAERVRAALSDEAPDLPPAPAMPHAGYHRLDGKGVVVVVDAGAPAEGAWSVAACAHPGAVVVSAGGERLICNGGWSPGAAGPRAFRLSAAASTVEVAGGSAGAPLSGFPARSLGPRLVGGATQVTARREEGDAGVWLDLAHDGWAASARLSHDRRLFVSHTTEELRGEDVLTPAPGRAALRGTTPFSIRFHLFPGVEASLARDGRSVLVRAPSGRGWWLRSDATEVALEESVVFLAGLPRRARQVVLRHAVGQEGARVRWKLSGPAPTPRARAVASDAAPAAPGLLA